MLCNQAWDRITDYTLIFSNVRLLKACPFFNLVPRALFPGFGAREKRPGDEVALFSLSFFLSFFFFFSFSIKLISWFWVGRFDEKQRNLLKNPLQKKRKKKKHKKSENRRYNTFSCFQVPRKFVVLLATWVKTINQWAGAGYKTERARETATPSAFLIIWIRTRG